MITLRKLFKLCITAVLFFLVIFNSAFASMIGDTLTIRRAYPDLNTDFSNLPRVTTVVEFGNADIISNQPGLYTINPESNSIFFDFTSPSEFGGTSTTFDGFEFTGFSNTISNAFITDISGVTIVDLTFGDNFITLNLADRFDSSSLINIGVDFESNAVPIPPSLFLFLSGLISLFGYRYKRAT